MFLHGGLGHLFFNMFALFMFGSELERTLGSKEYLHYYLACGLGAGIIIVLVNFLTAMPYPTLGASGAIFGLLLAYALFFPDRYLILLFPPIPIKVKWAVIGYGAISFLFLFGTGGGISHSGHLGGLITGIVYFLLKRKDYTFRPGNNNLAQAFSFLGKFFSLKPKVKIVKDDRRFSFHPRQDTLEPDDMTDRQIEDKIDELLEKISRQGVKALSLKEQLFLDKVSTLYKHKFPS